MTTPIAMPPGLVPPGPPPPPPAKPPPFRITVPERTELDELITSRELAKARVTEAEKIFDGLDKRLKNLLARLLPRGTSEIEVPGTPHRKGIRMSFRCKRVTDWDRLRAEHPQIDFDSYLKWGRPYFQIDKL